MKDRLLIGVIATECNIDFQEETLRGVIAQGFKANADIAIITTMHNFYHDSSHRNTDKYICDLVLSDRFSGFIYDRNTFRDEKIKKYIDDLLVRSGRPVMLLDSPGHRNFETTAVDDCSAFEKLTDHMIEVHGCRKIYCMTGPKGLFVSEERLSGYKNSMKRHGLFCGREHYRYGDFWKNASRELAADIISGAVEKPDAVICGNDIMAIELMDALTAGGIRVPEDIAITGYDASEEAYRHCPSITTYSRPNFQLGAEAFRRLFRIITGRICGKLLDEYGKLCLGLSCGCNGRDHIRGRDARRAAVNSRMESYLFYGDMLFDITNTGSLSVFADKLDNYTYLIYKLARIRICLTKKYIESTIYNDKLSFHCGDDMKTILAKGVVHRVYDDTSGYFSSSEILPEYGAERKYPLAYYIAPLHYNDNFFGYSAISFGKNPMSFSNLYLQWINYVNVALEQVRIKGIMANNILSSNVSMLYDESTELFTRAGVEQEIMRRQELFGKGAVTEFITIELTGINKIYYSSGEKRCREISRAFAAGLKKCVQNGDICGMWNTNTMCVVSDDRSRAGEIFEYLRTAAEESQFTDNNFNIDFSVGIFGTALTEEVNIGSIMYQSSVNRAYSYSSTENAGNPHYEKLCALRSRIRKDPAFQWKIGEIAEELYLSKSYLQKIYKNFFNKSIIEEMIEFRLEMAKRLLEETQLTVTEISRKCGYASYNYFVRQFRTNVGCTPMEYREKTV